MNKLPVILLSVLVLLTACKGDDWISSEPQLVVDGWIDSDGFPTVILTKSVVANKHYQSLDSLQNNLIRWAKVTVSDGTDSVILIGYPDRQNFPPYCYGSWDMRGEVGKTYTMTAKYEDFYVEASTTILPPVDVDSFVVERLAGIDTLYSIKAFFTDDPATQDYYKFFTHVKGHTDYYLTSHLGTLSDESTHNPISVDVHRGHIVFEEEAETRFSAGDTVFVKFAHIDESTYNFWKDHETQVIIGRNPMFPVNTNVHSNVRGGLGCWCGYGAREYCIIIPREEKRLVIRHPSSLVLSN